MRRLFTPVFTPVALSVTLALASNPAEAALGEGVFLFEGRSSMVLTLDPSVRAEWVARGATFSRSSTWPADLSLYRLIVLVAPAQNLSAAEQADLLDFMDQDGVVLLFEEAYAFSASRSLIGNSLLSDLGFESRLTTSSLDSVCSHTALRTATTPVSQGSPSLDYAYSGDISAGADATVLYEGESGQSLIVQEGRLVLTADTNLIDTGCALPSTQATFFGDLYDAVCDLDGDGVDSAACGGADCDDVDSAVGDTATFYVDADGDGDGDPALSVTGTCGALVGYSENGDDCDDADPTVYFGAAEVPYDSLDQDCDRLDLTDVDLDGSDGLLAGGDDCDDTDALIFVGQAELPDGADQDCDGVIDEGTTWFDDDGDGVSELDGDCDDALAEVSPDVEERVDGLDNNCNSLIDDGTEVYDDDHDGYAEVDGDCDDDDTDVNPHAHELEANGKDDDCDGTTDLGSWNMDADGDGWAEDEGDCDDYDDSQYPGAPELADAKDNDCDGLTDEGTVNRDDDGDGYSENQADCDDLDPATSPEAEEEPDNGKDDDCDGLIDEVEPTEDGEDGGSEEADADSGESEEDTGEAEPSGDTGEAAEDEAGATGKDNTVSGCSTTGGGRPRSLAGLLLGLVGAALLGGRRRR